MLSLFSYLLDIWCTEMGVSSHRWSFHSSIHDCFSDDVFLIDLSSNITLFDWIWLLNFRAWPSIHIELLCLNHVIILSLDNFMLLVMLLGYLLLSRYTWSKSSFKSLFWYFRVCQISASCCDNGTALESTACMPTSLIGTSSALWL